MQRYFPASRLVVFTTLKDAMNLRGLVAFVSFSGASGTLIPCNHSLSSLDEVLPIALHWKVADWPALTSTFWIRKKWGVRVHGWPSTFTSSIAR